MPIKKSKTTEIEENVVPEIRVALTDLHRFALRKLKQPLVWDSYFAALPEPKVELGVPQNKKVQDEVAAQLENYKLEMSDFKIDVDDYKKWKRNAQYQKNWIYYLKFGIIGRNLPEKSLEHYLATKFLELSENDVYIDVGSSGSPTVEIYRKMYGCKTYRQDLVFPRGMHGNLIGGDASDMPIEDGFASKMALHCAFEHFEGDSDISFIREASRVLRSGGKLCILPVYFYTKYAIQTDPTVLPLGGLRFERDATLFCSKNYYGNRHGRFYDASHFIDRIINNMEQLNLKLYRIQNEKEVDPSCHVKFVALFEKK